MESKSLSHTTWPARLNSWFQKARDSAIGSSFDEHVMGGYKFLMRYYSAGDGKGPLYSIFDRVKSHRRGRHLLLRLQSGRICCQVSCRNAGLRRTSGGWNGGDGR